MPRIPPEEIERIKREIPVQRLVEARGIKLQAHGKNLIGLCPFHKDTNPSLVLTPETNLWNCLGACRKGGSNIDWVMKAESVSFPHAVQILQEMPEALTHSKNIYENPPPLRRCERLLKNPFDADMNENEILKAVVDFYHESLKKSPIALEYLEKRGLKNPEMIDNFKLGFVDRTLCYRIPDRAGRWGAALRQHLWHLGITRKSGHEHFINFITFPVFDENGNVTEIYGRRATKRPMPDVPNHLYLPGPHKGVFNLEGLKTSKEIILCEAIIDVLSFWCAGFRNVTASYGINGFTPDHLEAFKKYGIEKVYIAYDRDEAGETAAKDLSEKLTAEGFEVFQILFPRGMDANEFSLKMEPASKAFELIIRNAVWVARGKRPCIEISEAPEIPSFPKEEPKAATKGKNLQESPSLETASQPSKQPEDFFPLAAEESSDLPSTPAPEPPRPEEPKTGKPEPAQPAPISRVSASEPVMEIKAEEIIIKLDDRRWRIRGLGKNMSYDQLKVNILVSKGERFFVDTFDLYSARCRAAFLKQASDEIGAKEDIVRSDLGKVLLKLEELQDKQIQETLKPKEKEIVLTDEERKAAMELLQDPNILNRILGDFEKCGLVGEETNKLVGYLGSISRKLDLPLGIIIQSSSAAGKTALMESILSFAPEEEKVKYSAMTGQSLFYMSETNLKHKILAIVEEEGAERASYAIKLLLTEGVLTIASTGKDPASGRLVTHEYKVEGPVMVFVTTTNIQIEPELQNRCIMLTVDESREQTRAIHKLQRERRTLTGLIAKKQKGKILKVHQNVQRLLKPVPVVNHYANDLTFLDDRTRTRRDNEKYLSLIETITLIHQYQRPFKTGHEDGEPYQFLEVLPKDIELANKLTHEVLGRSLDELPPQTRRFLMLLEEMVIKACERLKIERSEYRFYRRDILDNIGWTYDQIRAHMERLVELEYVIVHGGYQGRRFSYELLYDGNGKDGKPFCVGLIDVEALKKKQSAGS